jgi:hypothetical protein
MGIETSAEHGGSESSFTSAIIAIEELAKVDPSVSVMCDVHNTLVNTIFRTYGTKEQQDKWLPILAEKSVRSVLCMRRGGNMLKERTGWLVLPVGASIGIRCVRAPDPSGQGRERLGD